MIKNIFVSRLRFMGDIILTTPLLQALSKAYPDAKITYVTEEPFHQLLENHPYVDRIIALKKTTWGQIEVIGKLICGRYDIAIDLFGNPRAALLTWLSGAKIRIGGDFRGRKHFYTHTIKSSHETKTAVQFHLDYLKPLNIEPVEKKPFIVITEEESRAEYYLKEKGFDLDRPIIGIHPGATWPAKKWLPERFAALADKLVTEKSLQVLFTMGPGEEDLVKSVLSGCREKFIMPEVLPLRQLAAIQKKMIAFISNDCGVMHLAPAVGTPTIGIFGPGEPEIWFPYDEKDGHQLVYHELDCSRCHQDFCDKLDCMKSITVDDVFYKVEKILEKYDN